MEILQLRYFYESAQSGSFARTAEKYRVPTTSVSAAVRRLERELGCPLFDRSANRITLNANGIRLQQSLCLVFPELDGAVGALTAQAVDGREIRLLVRGMRRRITDLIVGYNAQNPQVRFKTVFDFRETDPENYDIIIDVQSDAYPQYERFPLCRMRLRFKCAPTDPLCGRSLTLRQLSGRRFVSIGEDSNLHRILLSACRRAGFNPNIAVVCNDIECYEKFIASGMGIAIGREQDPGRENVAYLNVTDFNEYYTLCVYYKRDAASSGNIRSFLRYLQLHA